MKKIVLSFCILALGTAMISLSSCSHTTQNALSGLPEYPISQGVSAPFAGFIHDELVVAGGCNFPDVPAADGGAKVYYDSLYTYNVNKKALKWMKGGQLPFDVAYGATVELEKGIVCIGGMNGKSSLKNVCVVMRDTVSDKLRVDSLPSLPESIDNAAASIVGQTIYVTGGNQGNLGNALYSLDLDKDSVWNKLADYPGAKRIQPVLLASDEALYLFGGFEVGSTTKEAIISSDFLVYDIKLNQWSESKRIPSMEDGSSRALVGCSGVRIGDHLLIAGGVNYAIFKAAVEGNAPSDYMTRPSDWYRFNKDILVYNFRTETWRVVPNVEGFNKAGGILLYHQPNLYMVCGEKKPGIRTSEIVIYPLDSILRTNN